MKKSTFSSDLFLFVAVSSLFYMLSFMASKVGLDGDIFHGLGGRFGQKIAKSVPTPEVDSISRR